MLILLFTLLFNYLQSNSMMLFDFKQDQALTNWRVVDDVVMGGRSDGKLYISKEGHGIFTGEVSLENNGGFSSARYRFETINTQELSKVALRVKGDGKSYQFRVKRSRSDYYSYIGYFKTSGSWETIEIPLATLYPAFRGRKLNMSNFPGDYIEEIAILIGNKKNENFRLEIDRITLK
ncbi:CIA30 family protein [Aureisphaera galaxeae]|uniref:CIA30 family protein n=1 Tax=Aureisphaera galaxeae TaxID=1538023 RepID=UPI00234FC393|nr:CIA30 family protein [Aureisphaera galaxeae]MDC8004148.1 CIA30 family protein [Aureisphaera galaxeae]